mmetsp:Transcript_22051/g.31999  ORF Transcript_22051/g.31999 Transcript_22051/m.31999 type:complete len:195 (+) Transcript_22051:1-585(+)
MNVASYGGCVSECVLGKSLVAFVIVVMVKYPNRNMYTCWLFAIFLSRFCLNTVIKIFSDHELTLLLLLHLYLQEKKTENIFLFLLLSQPPTGFLANQRCLFGWTELSGSMRVPHCDALLCPIWKGQCQGRGTSWQDQQGHIARQQGSEFARLPPTSASLGAVELFFSLYVLLLGGHGKWPVHGVIWRLEGDLVH